MNSLSEIIQRSDCYKLLAACFYEPDKKLLLEEKVCENLGTLLAHLAPDVGKLASDVALALQDSSQEQLTVDYAALFIGPFELIAAPYGSVYLEKSRRVMGDSTLGVLRFYQDAGLAVDVSEPPDHIVIELEFMYYLAGREASAVADGFADDAAGYREQQVRFLSKYLQPWVLDLCRSISSGTTNPFYRSLADCLGGFMSSPASRPVMEQTEAGNRFVHPKDADTVAF
ncbi:MAG: molecular chaperone TorD family protein [Proteobacteria bacterium]|nr:molecular chaperone TorD family protein [Pseudomonadota bacterium]